MEGSERERPADAPETELESTMFSRARWGCLWIFVGLNVVSVAGFLLLMLLDRIAG